MRTPVKILINISKSLLICKYKEYINSWKIKILSEKIVTTFKIYNLINKINCSKIIYCFTFNSKNQSHCTAELIISG